MVLAPVGQLTPGVGQHVGMGLSRAVLQLDRVVLVLVVLSGRVRHPGDWELTADILADLALESIPVVPLPVDSLVHPVDPLPVDTQVHSEGNPVVVHPGGSPVVGHFVDTLVAGQVVPADIAVVLPADNQALAEVLHFLSTVALDLVTPGLELQEVELLPQLPTVLDPDLGPGVPVLQPQGEGVC